MKSSHLRFHAEGFTFDGCGEVQKYYENRCIINHKKIHYKM